MMLCAAVKHGQDEVWHYVLKEYHSAKENERWKYLFALSCTSKKKTIERLDMTQFETRFAISIVIPNCSKGWKPKI